MARVKGPSLEGWDIWPELRATVRRAGMYGQSERPQHKGLVYMYKLEGHSLEGWNVWPEAGTCMYGQSEKAAA